MYSLERILNHLYLRYPHRRPSGLEALAINFTISQVAVGMVSMFGVLFVFELGKNLMEGLMLVVGVFGLQRVVVGLVVAKVAELISRVGYRWMMFIGLISLALKVWILMQVTVIRMWLLVPALVLGGIAIASYYLGYHGVFLADNDDERIGEQVGLVTMLGRLALMVSPVLAGFLVENFGFAVMFGVAMSLLIVSLTPLFLMPHHERKSKKFSFKQAVKLVKKKKGFAQSVFWWHVENGIQTFYWPIFLFLAVKSHMTFGVIVSLVMMLNSLAVYGAGKVYDRRRLRRVYPVASVMLVGSFALRFMAGTVWGIGAADGLSRLVSPFWWMKIRRNALITGEKVKAMVFAVSWEWAVTAGYLVALLVGFGLLWWSGGEWLWLVVPVGVSVWLGAKGVKGK